MVSTHRDEEFETPDLHLASFLFCRNFNFRCFRRLKDGTGRTAFVFEDSPELRHTIVDYANDGVVPVRTFVTTLHDLRALTRQGEISLAPKPK